MSESTPSILFVCIGNMCRSPLAEAFARHHGGDRVAVQSAGLSPSGQVHSLVREILREREIPDSDLRSKGIDTVDAASFDWVVSLAGIRAEAFLPDGFTGQTLAWAITDPIGRPRNVFEDVADDIEAHVIGFLKDLQIVSASTGVTGWAGMDGPGMHLDEPGSEETDWESAEREEE